MPELIACRDAEKSVEQDNAITSCQSREQTQNKWKSQNETSRRIHKRMRTHTRSARARRRNRRARAEWFPYEWVSVWGRLEWKEMLTETHMKQENRHDAMKRRFELWQHPLIMWEDEIQKQRSEKRERELRSAIQQSAMENRLLIIIPAYFWAVPS